MKQRRCRICGEPLDCVQCAGVGTITQLADIRCPECEGDGDVWADGGTRRVTCPSCYAEGIVSALQTTICWECAGAQICANCRRNA